MKKASETLYSKSTATEALSRSRIRRQLAATAITDRITRMQKRSDQRSEPISRAISSRCSIKEGDEVEEKQPIAVIEAMKMETNILAPVKGVVDKIYIKEGQQVKAGELIAKLK